MHITQVHYAYDPFLTDPDEALDRFPTLTSWSEALLEAGAERVTVVKRFRRDARLRRREVDYIFCRDGSPPDPRAWNWPIRLHQQVAVLQPDVAHLNGLVFPIQTWLLRRALPWRVALLAQDHNGVCPSPFRRTIYRAGLRGVDGFMFSAAALAHPWQAAHIIEPHQRLYEVMESSIWLRPMLRAEARAESGLPGHPALLWVGRLNPNKDPLTVLEGFKLVLPHLPGAHLTLIYTTEELLPAILQCLAASPALAERVHLRGRVPYAGMAAFYSAADFFVLGSHHEGSGYALLEALACGAAPVVTDIPAFRVLTAGGRIGALWPAGHSRMLADQLITLSQGDLESSRKAVVAHFEREFSWPVIGRRALAAYRELAAQRACWRRLKRQGDENTPTT